MQRDLPAASAQQRQRKPAAGRQPPLQRAAAPRLPADVGLGHGSSSAGFGGAGSGGAPRVYVPPVAAIGQQRLSTSGQPARGELAAGGPRATHILIAELLADESKAESEVAAFLAKHINGATPGELTAYTSAMYVDGYRSIETIAMLTPERTNERVHQAQDACSHAA